MEKSDGTGLEVSYILISFYTAGSYYQRREKIINNFAQQASVPIGLARHAYRYNNGTNVMEVTNHFLAGFKAHSPRWNPCLALLLSGTRTCG